MFCSGREVTKGIMQSCVSNACAGVCVVSLLDSPSTKVKDGLKWEGKPEP